MEVGVVLEALAAAVVALAEEAHPEVGRSMR